MGLDEIPITLSTNVSRYTLLNSRFARHLVDVSINNNDGFVAVPPIYNVKMARLGPPEIRWFHCQIAMNSPYDLMLYLDADATICSVDKLKELFNTSFDFYYSSSIWHKGYGMSRG